MSAICLVSFLLGAVLTYRHFGYEKEIYASKKAELKRLTVEEAKRIESILRQAMSSAEALADGLTGGTVNKGNMLSELKAMLAANENYYGGTITFAPFGYDAKTRLYSAYYSKSGADGALEFLQLATVYDYTKPDYDWYVEPMQKGNRWSEPYWDEAGRTYMTTYSALFYAEDRATRKKVPNGVVTVDISMSRIRSIIESLDIGPSGFGALTTRDGNYLYHPNYEYVQGRMNIRDVAREKNDKDRLLIADKAARGEGGIVDHISTTTGRDSWLIFETVPISGWSLQNTFIKDDLDIDVHRLRQQIIWILVSAIVFVSSLALVLLRVDLGAPVRVWSFTAIVSCLFAVGIAVIWNLALTYHSWTHIEGVKVSDKATLRALMNSYRNASRQVHLPEPIFIPTGLYLDAIEFTGANDLHVAGRIWQKYPSDYPKELAKGFQFGRTRSVTVEKTNAQQVPGGEVIQWSFRATLLVELDYSRYPLEVEHLALQILPLDPHQNLVLVPDLDAYKLITPTLLPGLGYEVFIPGWKLAESFFLLRTTDSKTNFGVERNFDREILPTLYFKVGVQRVFIDAFISNLTPLIVVAIILFALALLSKSVEIGRILGVCVAVFFVVVFSHLDIRKHIAAGEIFYLEYFFFVVYFTIILVPMDAIRLALKMRSRFFDYKGGLLANAIYWPSVLGTFFVITAVKFY